MGKKDDGPHPKRLLAVIDVQNVHQAMRNVRVAHDASADGVFLADFEGGDSIRHDAFEAIKDRYPDYWVGITATDATAARTIEHYRAAHAVWAQTPTFEPGTGAVTKTAFEASKRVRNYQHAFWKHGSYFGSVTPTDPHSSLLLLARGRQLFDTVVLSDDYRDHPPDPLAVRVMRAALDRVPLAVAGVFEGCLAPYLRFCDTLILSRRERSEHLSSTELSRLAKQVHR